jgi:tetratricopeptide (TPR) repeat protein
VRVRMGLHTGEPTIVDDDYVGLPARQRTLRGAIEWSYDLLDEEERTFFRRLAVFAGGFTLEAAEYVTQARSDLEALERTASLVDESLVHSSEDAEEEPRYAMLRTIREYATERLEEAGEAEEVRARHAELCLELVEQAEPELTGAGQALWGRRLQTESDNIRAALAWAIERGGREAPDIARVALRLAAALGRFWYTRGQLLEGTRWLEEALALDAGAGSERAKAMHNLGVLLDQRAEHERAQGLFEESLSLFRALGDTARVATSLKSLGAAALSAGAMARARALLEESLELRRKMGDEERIASTLSNSASPP